MCVYVCVKICYIYIKYNNIKTWVKYNNYIFINLIVFFP